MRCSTVLTRLDAFRTGELPPEETTAVETHVESCASCGESFEAVRALAGSIRSLTVSPKVSCLPAVRDVVGDAFGTVEIGDRVVRVAFRGNSIRMIDLSSDAVDAFRDRYRARFGRELREAPVPATLRRAVEDALRGHKTSLPEIDLGGATPFEREVLTTLTEIPRGEVRTYEWVAQRVGRPRATRAVGNAVARNPVPLLLPCHRVVPVAGGVGRYAFGSAMKRALLIAEGAPVEEIETLARRGIRFIGSATTKIFCVPSCRDARRIRSENRVPFRAAADAARSGFRPCRRCTPESRIA